MTKFKEGDKVKIPKTKRPIIGTSYDNFRREIEGYNHNYLEVDYPDGRNDYVLKRVDKIKLEACRFNETDLELYEEKYTIDYILNNKVAVKIDTIEQGQKIVGATGLKFGGDTKYYKLYSSSDTCIAPYRSPISRNVDDSICHYSRNWYEKEGYQIIDYSQINFEENMNNKKIIGYKCPTTLYRSIAAGTIFVKLVSTYEFYNPKGTASSNNQPVPREIVETWEPVYEEEFKVGDWVVADDALLESSSFWKDKGTFQVAKIGDYLYCEGGQNNYPNRFRKATQKEIDAASIVIGTYKAEKKGGDAIAFGCQSFSSAELRAIQRLFHGEINAKITIKATEITNEMINKLLQL